ncbi:MAG: nuclear transport factor 2 family protein [Pseudarcicella sp.]|nr:nuclear transport factor 2 family protein [Pseudarcicella sp.]MBP6409916.1 nuclear transport factor 2 family protein [Pseudarcicella sp.]
MTTIQKLKTTTFAVLVCMCISFGTKAQSEDENVKATVNNYLEGVMKGDTAKLGKAFHPSASLKTVQSNGAIQDFTSKRFIATVPAGGMSAKGAESYKILTYSYVGNSALATVEIYFGEFKFVDLLSMLKLPNGWKIVSRVYSKVALSESLRGQGLSASATSSSAPSIAKPAPKKASTANVKPKADDGW